MERFGIGKNHLSSGFFAPVSDDIVMIWFVPSRTVLEYGAMLASAIRLPSGDHVGIPGAFSVSWIFVTLPLATSTTDTLAARHIPFTSKNAIRLPSGDHVAPWGCDPSFVNSRLFPVCISWIQSCI